MVKHQLLCGVCLPCFERVLFHILIHLKNIMLEKNYLNFIISNWYNFISSNEGKGSQ